jgi:membrane-associated phospholipid phosphatase
MGALESIYVSTGTDLVQLVQLIRMPMLDAASLWLTRLGEAPALLMAAFVTALVNRQNRWIGLGMLAAFLLASLVNAELKSALDVPRPSADDVYTAREASGSATPSAHTMSAAAVWFFLALSMQRVGQVWLAFAAVPLVVGFTRVYLGMHYPGDVLLGLGLGGAIALLLHFAVNWRSLLERQTPAPQLVSATPRRNSPRTRTP